MRREEFKMERTGLLEVGDVLPITEGKLPGSYYYTLGKAYAIRGRKGCRCQRNSKRVLCDS